MYRVPLQTWSNGKQLNQASIEEPAKILKIKKVILNALYRAQRTTNKATRLVNSLNIKSCQPLLSLAGKALQSRASGSLEPMKSGAGSSFE